MGREIEFFDSNFEYVIYPCYQIKIYKPTSEFEIFRNKKSIKKFKQESFADIDFGNPDHIAKLLNIVKTEGIIKLMMKYGIDE